MKMIDVMTSQTCDDDPKLAANSPPLSKTRQQEDSKTRQRRWAATNCRLAEQVEAEKVLLSSDITRLRNQGDWKAGGGGEEDTSYGRCSSQDFTAKLRGNKLGCEELYWASVSDEDTVNAVGVSSVEDFHTMDRNATGGVPRCPRVSCTPPSPPGEKALDASPMETDIAEFFPDARTVTARLEVSMKKQGLSPRQRLLYRYQMEEMLTMQENNDDDEDISADMPDISADMPDISADMPDISADIPTDGSAPMSSSSSVPDQPLSSGAGLESESGFAESSSGSPYSWNNSSGSVCGGPDYSPDESSGRGSLSGGLVVRDCHICGYAPCSRDDYDAHMKRTHFTHKCHLCIYWSRSPGRLSRHMKTFHGEPNAADSPANRKPKNPRKYACKQCEFFTYVQEEIWNHTRVHVPASKLLSCPHCPFVCAFKHHMQYHMNNHLGHKPYRCSECNYRCNNKSMLNSHKKSHSNDYPYRCAVCNYAAKYRHALNIHLRKKRHFADGEAVLEDGGTARYVRSRSRGVGVGSASSRNPLASEAPRLSEGHDLAWHQESQQDSGTIDYDIVKQEPDTVDHSVNNTPYLHAVQQNAVYTLPDGGVQPSLLSISDLSSVKLMRYSPVVYAPRTTPTTVAARNGDIASHGRYNNPARGNNSTTIPSISVFSTTSGDQDLSSLYETSHQMVRISPCRRSPPRGTNYRMADLDQDLPHHPLNGLAMSGHHPIDAVRDFPSEFSTKERPLDLTSKPRRNTNPDIPNHRSSWCSLTEKVPRSCRYECQHCGIIFPERVLYSMHMEYHGPSTATTADPDPFQCNLCGQRTKDRREFFNHINQVAHKSSAI